MQGTRTRTLAAALILAATIATPTATRTQQDERRWIVMFHQQHSLPANADDSVIAAGGTVFARLPEVGALVATSPDPNFAVAAGRDAKVAAVIEDVIVPMIPSPDRLAVSLLAEAAAAGAGPAEPPGDDLQTGSEPFYNPFQWDKKRIRASNQGSYSVQHGRRDVRVAVLDTGADILPNQHIDIAPNLDFANSRSFFPVSPNPDGDPNPASWDDRHGHGSWCLSAVAAPINGRGMSGVAPNVTLVALKVLGDDGTGSFVSVAQALIYAAYKRFDVASMSIGGYLRRADSETHLLIKFVQRAVNFARQHGVTPVAALGNESLNMSDGYTFRDYIVVPAEIDGVIGVSATGYFNLKASYSNYGVGKTDVSAPGGDFAVQTPVNPTPLHRGSVLGAWATEACGFINCYVFASGTSMATPNAAGVVALIISQYGDFTPDNSRKAHMPPQAVESILQQTANNQPCPTPRTVNYVTVIPVPIGPPDPPLPPGTPVGEPDQRCQGNAGYNNFYGKGIVDAFKAVTEGR